MSFSSSYEIDLETLPDVGEQPHQPAKFSFQKRAFGTKSVVFRSFQPQWFQKWSWIHYDEARDLAFCFICVKAVRSKTLKTAKTVDACFISRGYCNWKDATGERGGFSRHETSGCHKAAVEAMLTIPATTRDVAELLSSAHAKEKAANRKNLVCVAECLKYLARQGLAIRGDGSEVDSNFYQLLLLRANDDPAIKRMLTKKTDKYTSASMQNELLQTMALSVVRGIATSIREVKYFAIMADEVTDASNREQVVLCFRWVDCELEAHEDFVGLHKVDKINADTLVAVVKDVILRLNLDLHHCRGQCYDGAANMAGSRSGTATQICQVEKRAVFTHCYGHALNLAVADVVKQSKLVRDVLDTVGEISKLLKYSPRRDSLFEQVKESISPGTTGFRTLCPTRWTVKAASLQSVIDNYDVFQDFWDEARDICTDAESRARINGVKAQMERFDFLFGLCLGECIMRHTDNLSKTLQSPSVSAADSQVLARLTCTTLERIRNDESFSLLWRKISALQEKHQVYDAELPRRRKAPRRFEVGTGQGTHPASVQDYFRAEYFQTIDSALACIKQRFDQPGYQTYCRLERLLTSAAAGSDYAEDFTFITTFYGTDIDPQVLHTQLELFESIIQSAFPHATAVGIHEIIKHIRSLSSGIRISISQVCILLNLLLVMPATNAVSERSASALRRVKTYLRTTMSNARLNNLLVLHVHKDRCDSLVLADCLNDFVSGSEHRLSLFGKF